MAALLAPLLSIAIFSGTQFSRMALSGAGAAYLYVRLLH
jgi:hypothetical protein